MQLIVAAVWIIRQSIQSHCPCRRSPIVLQLRLRNSQPKDKQRPTLCLAETGSDSFQQQQQAVLQGVVVVVISDLAPRRVDLDVFTLSSAAVPKCDRGVCVFFFFTLVHFCLGFKLDSVFKKVLFKSPMGENLNFCTTLKKSVFQRLRLTCALVKDRRTRAQSHEICLPPLRRQWQFPLPISGVNNVVCSASTLEYVHVVNNGQKCVVRKQRRKNDANAQAATSLRSWGVSLILKIVTEEPRCQATLWARRAPMTPGQSGTQALLASDTMW